MRSSLSPTEIEQWSAVISKVSKFVVHDYHDCEFDDIEQELWAVIFERPSIDVNNPGCFKLLTKIGKSIARKWRAQGLHITSQYTYVTSDVRVILEGIFEVGEWINSYCPEDAKSEDRMGPIDVRVDVKWAMSKLPEGYQDALKNRYYHGIEPAVNSKERRQLNRAIQRLTQTMNSFYASSMGEGHPGGRRAISNAHARYQLEEGW